jgi:hypothetical protein
VWCPVSALAGVLEEWPHFSGGLLMYCQETEEEKIIYFLMQK